MPLLDIFFAMLWFFLFVAWISVLFSIISDLFRSDMGGWGKALWTIFLIFLPVLGSLAYLVTQGDAMTRRSVASAEAAESAARTYIRDVAGTTSTADELAKLAALRDNGTLTEQEFSAHKAQLLA